MTARYTFDAAASRFTVQAFATGLLAGFGHSPTFAVRDFSGEIAFSPETLENAALELTVRADSLALIDDVKEKDAVEIQRAMRQDVLESARYPAITYRATHIAPTRLADNWYRLRIGGEMRLHGVTGQQEIDAQLRLNDGALRLGGEFLLSQSAYKIKKVSAVGGMIKLKEELKITFDLAATQQEQRLT